MKKIKLTYNQSKELVWNGKMISVTRNGEKVYLYQTTDGEIEVTYWDGSVADVMVIVDETFQEIEEEVEVSKCVICGKELKGYGNNADPVAQGECCNECNNKVVVPARIRAMQNEGKRVRVTLYNKVHEFKSANEAKAFLLECIAHSEGSEQNRYSNAYFKLVNGETNVTDGDL